MSTYIVPAKARGSVTAPPSKSMAHRLLIAAGLSSGISHIDNLSQSEDILATIDCLRALGADITPHGNSVTVRGVNIHAMQPTAPLRCRESGSTLRFFVPIALTLGVPVIFHGSEKLLSRPLSVFEKLCDDNGFRFEKQTDTLTVCGELRGGEYTVDGNISSQFITGLLFALAGQEQNSTIHIVPPLESRSYLHLTVAALQTFGVSVVWTDAHTLTIAGGQQYTATDTVVEGDFSGAAFLEALNILGGEVTVLGLSENSLQGDRVYRAHFEALAKSFATVDLTDCPDLAPIDFAIAAAKHGGVFTGTKRLKIKESDRAAAMAEELRKFGVSVTVTEDTVTVHTVGLRPPCVPLCGHNDHRIVMALATLCTVVGGKIDGAAAVAKSYPEYFTVLQSLGVEVLTDETA